MSSTSTVRPLVRRGLRRAEKTGLITVMTASALLALGVLAAGIVHTVLSLRGTTSLFLQARDVGDVDWSALSPTIVSGQFDTVSLTLEGVEPSALALYAWTMGAGFAVVAATCAFVFYLCLRLYRRKPFGKLVTRGFLTLSVLFIVGTFVMPAILSEAQTRIVESMGIADGQAPFTPEYLFGPVDALGLMCGIFLALVAGAFHLGSHLQRDSEGLV